MSLKELIFDPVKRTYLIRIFIVGVVLFYNSASAMYIYSFLPHMMVDFGVVDSPTASGKYGAWMASGYFFGRFISSPAWGAFIDRSGRKAGVMIVLCAISTLTLAFGISTNFWWALSIRVITGFINGLSIIGKVLTTEVVPDDMKSVSISIISTLWSLGMTVGPFFGSFFYKWIPTWPYLASAIAVALMGYLLMFLVWVFIEETLDNQPVAKTPEQKVPSKGQDYLKVKNDEHAHNSDDEVDSGHNVPGKGGIVSLEMNTPAPEVNFNELNRYQQLLYLLKIPNVMPLIFIFSCNTFYAAVYGELIPFWAAAEYKDGGLDFHQKDISQVFVYLTGPQLFIQLFLYPYLQKRKGDFWLLSVGHFAHIPLFIMIPYAHYFPKDNVVLIKSYLIFWMFIRNLGSFMNFSALQRYTNDSISPQRRGQINGFQIAFSSLLQTLGPVLGGFVLAWSMEIPRMWPFNYHFVFLIMAIITCGTLYVIYSLDFVDKERKKLRGENGIIAE